MKVLNPNVEEKVVFIPKNLVYVYVTDYGKMALLKEIKVDAGQHTWYWMDLKEEAFINISGIKNQYCTFENAINRAINDPYCTVYSFHSFEQFALNIRSVVYVDSIKTVYKTES